MTDDVLLKYDLMESVLDSGSDTALQALPDTERADELDDVLVYLRRYKRDSAVLGVAVPPLDQLIAALERGEHRR